jgi:hypothetical protein
MPKSEKFPLQYSIMMTNRFYTNRRFASKEIRFTAASNAFTILAYLVAGNGCRPSFSEIPYLAVVPSPVVDKNPQHACYRLHAGGQNLSKRFPNVSYH